MSLSDLAREAEDHDPPGTSMRFALQSAEEQARIMDDAERTWDNLEDQEDRTRPLTGDEIAADPVASILLPESADRPRVRLERIGPSYRAVVRPLGARFTFRDFRTDRDFTADLDVNLAGQHLLRSTVTLSLTGRDKVAKVASDLSGRKDLDGWRRAVFAAVEAVLEAEEQIAAAVDLRGASLALPDGGVHLVRPIWPLGSAALVSPGDGGKSTVARALEVSIASGRTVIPGIEPVGGPKPCLFVAAEDPVAYWHARSIEAICRGQGIDRSSIAQPIVLFDARGRPLHRIARAIAERAPDFGAIVLDSQQALLAPLDAAGGIRDRDSVFWHAIDQLEVPTLIIAHPNRADARDWTRADGRIAGSEVNRDRSRMAWQMQWLDEPAVVGTSFRRYTLTNVKNNHGPREAPIAFGMSWTFGAGDDPGVLQFVESRPIGATTTALSAELAAALAQYRDGITTPAPLAKALGINENTAKSRLRLLRAKGLLEEVTDDV